MYEDLVEQNFIVIAIAIDENIDGIKELAKEITYPVLIDADHLFSDLYTISNVPTVIWVDENDTIVRPNAGEFGTDTFTELTGISCIDHIDQVKAWVAEGVIPEDAQYVVDDFDLNEVKARLHFRIAVNALRAELGDVSEYHFKKAEELAPLDFTIVRASMPLRGGNPFGQEFFDLYEKYHAAGSPYHGIPRRTAKLKKN